MAALLPLALWVTFLAGWINNAIWTFHQDAPTSLLLGIVGIFAAPIGAVHGIWLWF